jgi:hypothetical protein
VCGAERESAERSDISPCLQLEAVVEGEATRSRICGSDTVTIEDQRAEVSEAG